MTIKKRFLISYLSAFIISISSLLLILSLVFYLTLNKIPSVTEVYKMITKQRALTIEEEESFIALDRIVKKSPDLLNTPLSEEILATIHSIEKKGLEVVIRKNKQFSYYSSNLVEKSLIAHSPDYELNNFTPAGTLDNAGRLFHYIKLDFKYLDGSSGSFIILKRESNLFEFFTKWGIWIILIIIAIAIFSAWLINYRLTKTTIEPLEELESATTSIANFTEFIQSKKNSPPVSKSKEVRQLEESFEQMWRELQKAEADRSRYEDNRKELVANISHDLKTPITSIIGHVEGLQDGVANTEEKQQRYLEIIHKQGTHLNELIEELFLYSKLDLDAVIFDKKTIDFIPYIRHLLEEYHWDNESHLTTDFPTEELLVSIDPIQMNKVLTNLIQNSLKFRDKTKVLTLDFKIDFDNDHLFFSLRDNGTGISQDELAHVFRRFYRVDKSRTPLVKGSGLGLSIVKQIVEHHNGSIQINSQLGEYTQIIITLPRLLEDYHDKKDLNY